MSDFLGACTLHMDGVVSFCCIYVFSIFRFVSQWTAAMGDTCVSAHVIICIPVCFHCHFASALTRFPFR